MSDRTHGPASYFPAIEKKYGRPIAEWQQLLLEHLAGHSGSTHLQLVGWLKSQHGMGHGHANALVAQTLVAQTLADDRGHD